jgi:CRISPR-associated protein Csx10
MIALRFSVALQEPLLVTGIDGDPNSKVSLDYIPGAAIRGAAIAAYMRKHNKRALDLNTTERRLFFSDQVRFLNAYIETAAAGKRSLPTPKFLTRNKYGNTDQINVSLDKAESESVKQKPVTPYSYIEGKSFYGAAVRRQVRVHTTRNRDKGRATENDGEVFRYDALAAYQAFHGVILCEQREDVNILQDLLSGTAYLGGSRSAGYGRVSIAGFETTPDWKESSKLPDSGQVPLVLASDAILRDQAGEYRTDLGTLCAALGCSAAHVSKSEIRMTMHGAFNRTWGMEMPQTPALLMGSYVCLDVSMLDRSRVEKAIKEGIGERRNEGFGRVIVLVPELEGYKLQKAETDQQTDVNLLNVKLPDHIKKRREHLSRQTILLSQGMEIEVQPNGIAGSQINSIRSLIADALNGKITVADMQNQIVERKSASRKQLEKARIAGKPLYDYLTKEKPADEKAWLQKTDLALARMAKAKKGERGND